MQDLGRDGGYIFAPCNAIQADTPPENVEAVCRAGLTDATIRRQHGGVRDL